MKGLRYGKWKIRLDLIPALWTWALGDVLTRGAIKYRDHNWTLGMAWHDVAGPMKRHMEKWLGGEVYDKDTGCHHLSMVAWNALALMTYQLLGLGTNDLNVHFDTEFISGSTFNQGQHFQFLNNLSMEDYVDALIEQGVLNKDGSQKTRDEQLELEDEVIDLSGIRPKGKPLNGGHDGVSELSKFDPHTG